jgi:hypothetical protein
LYLFCDYLSLSADGYEAQPNLAKETLLFKTTYLDGDNGSQIIGTDADSFYLQAGGQTGFYLSNKKWILLLDG